MTNTTLELNEAPANTGYWRGVFFDGPQSDQNHDGDHGGPCGEHPVWFVYIGDDEAEPVSHLSKFHNFDIAEQHAKHLAQSRRLDLIHEASPD